MTRKLSSAIGLFLVLLLGVWASPILAQGNVSGSIEGTVKDSGGAPVPGVTVTVSSDALVMRKMTTVTDARGGLPLPVAALRPLPRRGGAHGLRDRPA